MIRMDQELVWFDLTLTEGPIESLQHQHGLHPAVVQIDTHSQMPPSSGDADLGDVTSTAPVGNKRGKVLPHQEAL